MEEIKFYKAKFLPSPLSPADDGIYFIKDDLDTEYTSYIISDGVVVDQKLTLQDVIPYIGANKPIDINIQDFITNGRLIKGPNHFEIKDFSGNTASNNYLHKYTDVAYVSSTGTNEPWVITLPVRAGNMRWLMQLDIVEPTFNIQILVSANGITNQEPKVTILMGGNRIENVVIGRDGFNNTVIVVTMLQKLTGLRYANINKFYHSGVYDSAISVKTNYKVEKTATSNIPGFTINHTITDTEFERDTYYLDYNNLINKPTIANNYLTNIVLTNGTTNGPVYTFVRNGLSSLTQTIPAASTSFSGVVTIAAQTFAGPKTFTDNVTVPAATANGHSVNLGQVVGAVIDVQYNTTTHLLRFVRLNAPNIDVDLDLEALIANIDVVGDDLVITFQDGSTKVIPLNQLLVGVVKSVNNVLPDSFGNVSIGISDIPGLVAALAGKFDKPTGTTAQYIRGDGSLATLPIVIPGNGNISYMGTGAITGGGVSTANQSGNTSFNFDLLQSVKDDIADGKTAYGWGDHSAVGYLTSVSWGIITGKPTTFPPSAHTHPMTDVVGLVSALAGKSDVGHTHAWADITGKPTLFPPSTHTHVIADVTGLQSALDNKSNIGHTHAWNDITGKPSTFTPSAHTHTTADVISLFGYTLGSNIPLGTQDTLNAALGKLQAQINSKTNNVGTVTSVGLTPPTGFTVSNSPIVNNGNIGLNYASGYQGYTTAEANKLASLQNLTSGANTLYHYVPGLGNGTIWTAHNFNPASKANANNTITINGNTQMLGNNPNFTVSGGGTPTRIGANGAGYVAGDITFYGQGNTTVTQNGTDVYITSSGGAGGGSAGFDEVLPFTTVIGAQPDNFSLFAVTSRQTPYAGLFNTDKFTDLPPSTSLINVTGICDGYVFDGSFGTQIKSSGSFLLASHAAQYARDNFLLTQYPYLVLLDDAQTNHVEAKWMSPVQVFQMHDWGNMRGGAKLIGYLVETDSHEVAFEFNQQIIVLREFYA